MSKSYYKSKSNLNKDDDGINFYEWLSKIDNNMSNDEIVENSNYLHKKVISNQWDLFYIFRDLIRNHKYLILDSFLSKINISSIEKRKYRPLNENVWVSNKQNPAIITSNDIIKTFKILIKYFRFTDLSENTQEPNSKIDILDMLKNPKKFYMGVVKRDKRLPNDLQNKLFVLLTKTLGYKTPDSFLIGLESEPNTIMTRITNIINNYFHNDKILKKRLETAESFLGALLNKENKILPNVRNDCYEYFTNVYLDCEHFSLCLREIVNKITKLNYLLYKDLILFIISRDVETISYELVKCLVEREFTGINERLAFSIILDSPSDKIDFKSYFEKIDIIECQNRFILHIISNYKKWLPCILNYQKQKNPNVPDSEFITNNYSVILMMFGISYYHQINQSQIIDEIKYLFDTEPNIIRGFGIFIETSQIDLNNLTNTQIDLLKYFITKCYYNNSIKNKMTIESIFGKLLSTDSNKIIIQLENIQFFMNNNNFINNHLLNDNNNLLNDNNNFINNGDNNNYDNYNDNNIDEFDIIELISNVNPKISNAIQSFLKCKYNDQGLIDSIDNVIFGLVEQEKIPVEDIALGLIPGLVESKFDDIPKIKKLLEYFENINGYSNIIPHIKNIFDKYPNYIENLSLDNPKIANIISSILVI